MIDSKIVKSIGKKCFDYSYGFGRGVVEELFCIPRMLKISDSRYEDLKKDQIFPSTNEQQWGYEIAIGPPIFISILTLGIAPIAAYIAAYHKLFQYNPKLATGILATQITTNAMSGFYEWYQSEKKKSRKNAANDPSPLEAKVETPQLNSEITPSVPKEKIPNPWDYDIDEIKMLSVAGKQK
jgi:hypothetical protein